MSVKVSVYIGLGSNLDDPLAQIQTAVATLNQTEELKVLACSSLYGSKPQGPQDQPDFANAVCLVETTLSPLNLLACLQAIEQQQGRVKKRHWGERLIDLDILLYGAQVISTEVLTVPHAEIANRDFVLIPLVEIAPDLVIPNFGSIGSLISKLDVSYLKPLAESHAV
ncbi:MAG: 2-amino-4-hydroxy-6-hydroxymethyldihydropteridine diphosphokinase [Gammaproteobacteria bacterium]|nr:2-amino-4-hydroxy-6-hydroxymethyldihydropteridine diphosphokinase [Gammaproteobacteria bacterium]